MNDPNHGMMVRPTRRITPRDYEAGQAAMDEFDIRPVGLDQPGAPNPSHIADLLADLHVELEDAIAAGDLGAIVNATDQLGRLRSALETWEFCVLYRSAHRTA